ncbi:MAG TPA: STAS domain-containing protein [Candidatus Ruania gallistercoris]|uniref:STAS domain-containing protein n=1 Tax=Candidatus Ruania gallistercoris TaxID=2838746 RepID=A0A9D2EBC0_9MICO|nr:STAS domain-containing protein [Candidatus Ruania gallistercoris]
MPDGNSSGTHVPRESNGAGSVHTLLDPDRTRLVLSGEIDVALTDELTDAVTDAEAAGLPVQVDARHVTFMDSSGIALLARLANRTPGRLSLIKPPDVVRFLLDVTRIGDLVDVVEGDQDVREN